MLNDDPIDALRSGWIEELAITRLLDFYISILIIFLFNRELNQLRYRRLVNTNANSFNEHPIRPSVLFSPFVKFAWHEFSRNINSFMPMGMTIYDWNVNGLKQLFYLYAQRSPTFHNPYLRLWIRPVVMDPKCFSEQMETNRSPGPNGKRSNSYILRSTVANSSAKIEIAKRTRSKETRCSSPNRNYSTTQIHGLHNQ